MDELRFGKVSIIMGSRSDWPTMKAGAEVLDEIGVPYETGVVSAHRTPHRMVEFGERAQAEGVQVIIAGAAYAAHLPGMMASLTTVPVIGVPVESKFNQGLDSLLSIVQMPRGIAVATQAVGVPGAFNAGVLAAQIIGLSDPTVRESFAAWRANRSEQVPYTVE